MRKPTDSSDPVFTPGSTSSNQGENPFRSALSSGNRPLVLKPVAQRQFETFVTTARTHGCDESGRCFEAAVRRLFASHVPQG